MDSSLVGRRKEFLIGKFLQLSRIDAVKCRLWKERLERRDYDGKFRRRWIIIIIDSSFPALNWFLCELRISAIQLKRRLVIPKDAFPILLLLIHPSTDRDSPLSAQFYSSNFPTCFHNNRKTPSSSPFCFTTNLTVLKINCSWVIGQWSIARLFI